nr:inositol hexakisphosphate kinase 3 isoform X2 [Microcebus murinus]
MGSHPQEPLTCLRGPTLPRCGRTSRGSGKVASHRQGSWAGRRPSLPPHSLAADTSAEGSCHAGPSPAESPHRKTAVPRQQRRPRSSELRTTDSRALSGSCRSSFSPTPSPRCLRGVMVVQGSADARVGVQLEPFLHQVGGHMSVMKYDEHTVCKPLVSREQRFYESLPLAMKRFTPQYKGTITVHLWKDSQGHLSLVANPLKENQEPFKVSTESAAVAIWQALQQTTSGSGSARILTQLACPAKESGSPAKVVLRPESHLSAQVSSRLEDAGGNQAEKKSFNPWGLHCHQAHLTRLRTEFPEDRRHRFLLLENVVSPYTHPCILDLKMGTRQHGDDASEEKKARHMKKCAQSTSARLGVRICGMQMSLGRLGMQSSRECSVMTCGISGISLWTSNLLKLI